VKALVLAAGFGTRLRPITSRLPKPLVPLCNKPLIRWAIDSLLEADIDDLIVNLHHLPEQLESWLRGAYPDLSIRFSFEQEILGTGGAVRRVRPLLAQDDDFYIVNADTVQRAPFAQLAQTRREHDALAALTLRHPPAEDRFTPVWLDDWTITGFGSGTGEALMFSGVHLVSRRILDYLPDKEFSGIVDEVYQPLLESGSEQLAGVIDDGLWFDVGTPQRYLGAHAGLLDAMSRGEIDPPSGSSLRSGSLIDERATISGQLTKAAIGARSTVLGTVTDSAVWDDCFIGEGVTLERCIVAHGMRIEGEQVLRDQIVC
jgi:NDP-sugar pyrophosphorylase family protein